MNNLGKPAMPAEQRSQTGVKPVAPKIVASQQLLGNGRECWITHAGQTYRLCHTRNDKLILIK